MTFADAWRITNDTSLFDYAPGESTEITIKNFPAEPDVVTLADLTPEQRAAGEARCKNIGISFLHDMCVFDVGYTGVDMFGDIYDITADVVDNRQLTGSAERVRIVNLYVNDDGSTPALDVYGWTTDGPTLVGTVEYDTAVPPTGQEIPVNLAAGQQATMFVYVRPTETELRTIVVPYAP